MTPPPATDPASSSVLTTPSPCARLCTLNDEDICVGCGRTLDDIRGWTRMAEPEKQACVARARETLRRLGRPVPAPSEPQR